MDKVVAAPETETWTLSAEGQNRLKTGKPKCQFGPFEALPFIPPVSLVALSATSDTRDQQQKPQPELKALHCGSKSHTTSAQAAPRLPATRGHREHTQSAAAHEKLIETSPAELCFPSQAPQHSCCRNQDDSQRTGDAWHS